MRVHRIAETVAKVKHECEQQQLQHTRLKQRESSMELWVEKPLRAM